MSAQPSRYANYWPANVKRALAILIGLLLLVAAAAWGYWTYRQHRSYQTPIPIEAKSVIRISVDALSVDLAWNVLWNRSYYQGKAHEKPMEFNRETLSQTGISVPANVFLYQLDSAATDASPALYFGSVPLADTAEFSNWLTKQSTLIVQRDTLGKFAYSDHVLAVYDANNVFFAVSPQKIASTLPVIRKKIDALMTSDAWSAVSESPFRDIQKSSGHIVIRGEQEAAIKFKKGRILFSFTHTLENPPTSGVIEPRFPESNTASLWIAGIPSFLAGKPIEIGPYTLLGDSLLEHYQGNLIAEWKGTVKQQDTVISYDYDEDFTMHEREELVEKSVPEVYLSIAADDGLLAYLQTQGMLGPQGVNRDAMPLYQLYISAIPGGFLQFHTADRYSEIPAQHAANDRVLYLRINFGRMDPASLSPMFTPYIQLFDHLEVSGRRTGEGNVSTQGTLRMHNTQINSLIQLVNALKSAS